MSKNAFFIGQPIFSQLIKFIPKSIIRECVKEFSTDRYVKKFMTYDHLIAMLYCCITRCESLRELTTGLQANMNKLRHLGLNYTPRRSTLSDANKNRDQAVFGAIFHRLVKLHFPVLSDSSKYKSIEDRLFIIDSTTVTLFSNIMKGAGPYKNNGRKKGGAKAHVLLKAKENVPVFVMLTQGKEHDQLFMRYLPLPFGSFVVMDKAYVNSRILHLWDENGVTWVSRLRKLAIVKTIKSLLLTEEQKKLGLLSDQMIQSGSQKTTQKTKIQIVRLVTYYDRELNKLFHFTTNNFEITAEQVAMIYKKRWQIELMFKRWKQSNPLKYFLGDNENAVKIQIWSAMIADLLVQIVKKKLNKSNVNWSFSNLAGLLRHHIYTYINLFEFLKHPEKTLLQYILPNQKNNQLELFDSS